jgi:hypothetical protein
MGCVRASRWCAVIFAVADTCRYQHLTRALATRSTSIKEELQELLHGAAWVWVGATTFVRADQVAFVAPANVAPYLFSVPSFLSVFAGMLEGTCPPPPTNAPRPSLSMAPLTYIPTPVHTLIGPPRPVVTLSLPRPVVPT